MYTKRNVIAIITVAYKILLKHSITAGLHKKEEKIYNI